MGPSLPAADPCVPHSQPLRPLQYQAGRRHGPRLSCAVSSTAYTVAVCTCIVSLPPPGQQSGLSPANPRRPRHAGLLMKGCAARCQNRSRPPKDYVISPEVVDGQPHEGVVLQQENNLEKKEEGSAGSVRGIVRMPAASCKDFPAQIVSPENTPGSCYGVRAVAPYSG